MKDSAEIIEKIQKLLALANSSNEHEAKLAAERATALLTKYNLSMQDVAVEERDYEAIHFMGVSARMQMEQKYLFSILMEHFFIKVVVGKRFNPKLGKTVRVWSFFGQKHNVEVARYVYAFLDVTFHNLYEYYAAMPEAARGKTIRNSFYMGLSAGIRSQLKETQVKVQEEAGLVVVPDAGLQDFMDDTVGKTRKLPTTSVSINRDAYATGVEEGKNIRIARGLGGAESKQAVGSTLKLNGSN
jgi:hypothetical protein